MNLLTATAVDCSIPRNTDKRLEFEILNEQLGIPYNLTDHTVYLLLITSRSDYEPLIVKEGDVYSPTEGLVRFDFLPEDTALLLARSYDADIIVVSDTTNQKWPAFQGTIAVLATVPMPEEEEEEGE